MKNTVLGFLTLIGIALAAFFILKNAPTQETNTIVQRTSAEIESEFNDKQKCIGYREDIEKKMSETRWTKYHIEDIFYSPVENSCLFSVIAYQQSSALLNTEFGAYMIWDFLSDNLIFYRDTSLTNGDDIEAIYKNAVEHLEGKTILKYDKKSWNLE